MNDLSQSQCPWPNDLDEQRVLLAHGEGGALTRQLLIERILPHFRRSEPVSLDDAVLLPRIDGLPVLTADAFVVSPLFFPGGDIGTLAVYGAVNDLAVRGAEPLWLTLSMILEEGLPLAVLDRIVKSIAMAADRCGVAIVAGDTKVVPRGAADGVFLCSTGLGRLVEPSPPGASRIEVGDVLLISGPIARHGIAILAARQDLRFDPPPTSDCSPLIDAVAALRAWHVHPKALRDATRGGVAAVLHEWARDCGHTLTVEEAQAPVSAEVRGVCELLGIDPLCVANEGTMVVAVSAHDAEATLAALHSVAGHAQAAVIGAVRPREASPVVVRRILGRDQPLVEPRGAPLPRIC